MRINWRTDWPMWLLLAGMWVLALVSWGSAPDRIPVHWGLSGQPDRWGGRFEGLLLIPLLAVGIWLLMLLAPRLDPWRASYATFTRAYAALRLAVLALLAAIHALVVAWAIGRRLPVEVAVPLLVGAMFIVLGLVLARVRPNWFVGVRTPWTLSSERSWTGTHRAAGVVFPLIGVVFLIDAFVHGTWMLVATVVALLAGLIGLCVLSWVLWRADPDKLTPAGAAPRGRTP